MKFDKEYANHCIDDLNKLIEFLKFFSDGEHRFEKIDCILELLEDYKESAEE